MRRLFPALFLLIGCYLDLNDGLADYMVYYLVEVENNMEMDIAAYGNGQFRVEKGGKCMFFIADSLSATIPAHSSGEFSIGWSASDTDKSFNFVLNDGSRDYLFAGWREQVYQAPDAVVYGLGYGTSKKQICFERDGKTEIYSVKGVVDVYGKLRLVFNSPDDIQCAVVGSLTTDKESVFGDIDVRR
ncbi:MAG: hypothetical protein LBE74_03500 [Treponema sp.]|jgi:hypothetical protein|nr:hypothetical protein [Treponema sp.]